MVFLRNGRRGGREVIPTKREVLPWKLASQTRRTTLKTMHELQIYFPLFSPPHPLARRHGNFMNFSSVFELHYKKQTNKKTQCYYYFLKLRRNKKRYMYLMRLIFKITSFIISYHTERLNIGFVLPHAEIWKILTYPLLFQGCKGHIRQNMQKHLTEMKFCRVKGELYGKATS